MLPVGKRWRSTIPKLALPFRKDTYNFKYDWRGMVNSNQKASWAKRREAFCLLGASGCIICNVILRSFIVSKITLK
jgi:hypothetical protein